MKRFLLAIEPLVWLLLFGPGILLGTMLLTGWLLVVGVLAPLGVVPQLDYAAAHGLAASLPGRIVLLLLLALPLWKGAHHLRSLAVDFGGGERDATVATALYGVALLGSLLALVAVIRL